MAVVSVWDSKPLQVTILALRAMRSDLRKELYARVRSSVLPDWTQTLADEIGGDLMASRLLLKNTRVKVGTNGIVLEAATRTKPALSGGLQPDPHFYLVEFGATPRKAKVAGRRGNTTYQYERMVNTGMKPRRRAGYYTSKAADKIIKRTLAMWVSSTFQLMNEAFERGER